MNFPIFRSLLLIFFVAASLPAQEPAPNADRSATEDPVHQELRAFRKEITEAINAQDVDRLLKHVTDDVIVTWQNAEISRGPDEVRKYYDRMMKGDSPIVKSLTIDPVPDQLTKLIGDAGIAHGTSKDHFELTDGRDFTIDTVWSATVVRDGGAWKIASFHASANMFGNPVLWIAVRQSGIWAGIAGLLVGALLGIVVVLISKRKKAAAHGAT